jgi:hypothetical protein
LQSLLGENDIGNGISLDNGLITLRPFLDAMFSNKKAPPKHCFTFLGPEFEPWVEDDPAWKKAHSKTSKSLARWCCEKHDNADQMQFIDAQPFFVATLRPFLEPHWQAEPRSTARVLRQIECTSAFMGAQHGNKWCKNA